MQRRIGTFYLSAASGVEVFCQIMFRSSFLLVSGSFEAGEAVNRTNRQPYLR